ncbi:ACP S-malonyltransferase [Clostridium estertheticum]|uniref:Malonyl CoA-acyl carrier protein transacylase n=1 Tax=Clostridium estertheticum TaxID=238834 RepID=A0A5N7IU46_9CLOT|nr:ACP S-malonyltransferase [Clostridium estertheticum]MBU3075568.1 ACP S-malonyltransferase [Clostridium estertheticum]MBU3164850.1 ACP S-malonyltransferase [Clostridium estertheticum]MBU3174559.1 ACP S-malonyltransferase [Clostridium estertheticum]MBU3187875.1 ACP S-malonyltransferase [Clostridium estertheticum]MCB2342750.1 ACP S-malonyltransferase [Clostridium estertheticum]
MSKIAFIFPGQGAQYIGMGKELFENIEECKDIFNIADKELNFELSKLCFEGEIDELNITENTQPAILTVSIAALMALQKHGIKCDVTAGLSLGEYSALVCSGAMDFKDAVKLVKKRGRFMQEAVPVGIGTMAAVIGLETSLVEESCNEAKASGIVEIANLNCPGQIVIAGEIAAVELACEKAKEKGAKRAIVLSVSAPFHSSMLKPAAEKLEIELKNISFNDIIIPLMTNVNGDYVKNKDDIKDNLKLQVMSSVLWETIIKRMIKDGVDTFVEIGPGKVLSGFVKKIDRKLTIVNIEDMDSLNKAVELLKI